MKKWIALLAALILLVIGTGCDSTQPADSEPADALHSEVHTENIEVQNVDFMPGEIPELYVTRAVGFGAENFWYDVAIGNEYTKQNVLEYVSEDVRETYLAFCGTLSEAYLEDVERYRQMAEGLLDRGYILLASPSYTMYTDPGCLMEYSDGRLSEQMSNAVIVEENDWIYEMNVDDFHEVFMPALREQYLADERCPAYENLCDMTGAYARVTRGMGATYNYMTGERLTAETLFADGYDYEKAISAYTKQELTEYHGYDGETADRMIGNLTYFVAAGSVRADVYDGEKHCTVWIPFHAFPKEALTIFE